MHLLGLPQELVDDVLRLLPSKDLKSVSLVNRSLSCCARRLLFSTIRLSDRHVIQGIDYIARHNKMEQYIRRLELCPTDELSRVDVRNLDFLAHCRELLVTFQDSWKLYMFLRFLPTTVSTRLKLFEIRVLMVTEDDGYRSAQDMSGSLRTTLLCVTGLDAQIGECHYRSSWAAGGPLFIALVQEMTNLQQSRFESGFASSDTELQSETLKSQKVLNAGGWQMLHSLSLTKLVILGRGLHSFLRQHGQSLRSLIVSEITLTSNRDLTEPIGWLEIIQLLGTSLNLKSFQAKWYLYEKFPGGIDWFCDPRPLEHSSLAKQCTEGCNLGATRLANAMHDYVLGRGQYPFPERAIIKASLASPDDCWKFNGHECPARWNCGDASFLGTSSGRCKSLNEFWT